WLDFTIITDISTDGRTVLTSEEGVAGGPNYSVYLRQTDGSPAVRLGEGSAGVLSPNGPGASSLILHPSQIRNLPTGVGDTSALPKGSLESYGTAGWFPDSEAVLFQAAGSDGKNQLYRQAISGGLPQALSPPVNLVFPRVSPDGKWIAGDGAGPQPRPQL